MTNSPGSSLEKNSLTDFFILCKQIITGGLFMACGGRGSWEASGVMLGLL